MTSHRPRGYTLIELLVTLAVVLLVIALAVPGLVRAREQARATQCRNNLRQLGLAVNAYEKSFRSFPSGIVCRYSSYLANQTRYGGSAPTDPLTHPLLGIKSGSPGYPDWAWSALLLQQIDQSELSGLLNTTRRNATDALADPQLATMLRTSIPVFLCPADTLEAGAHRGLARNQEPLLDSRDAPHPNSVALGSYIGSMGRGYTDTGVDRFVNMPFGLTCDGVFDANSATTFDKILDGSSNTLMFGERAWKYSVAPEEFRFAGAARMFMNSGGRPGGNEQSDALGTTGLGINYPHTNDYRAKVTYSSMHAGGALFCLADGSVRFISEHISNRTVTNGVDSVFEALAGRADGITVGEF